MTPPSRVASRRRAARFIGPACALGGCLLIGVALAPALLGRTAFLPADYWMATVPFALTAPRAVQDFPSNSLLGDPALLYPPQLWVLREALRDGVFPLWNRFARGGESMLGTGQSGPIAPTAWPILALPWPLGFAWAAALGFGLLWLGAYLYGRAMTRAALPLAVFHGFAPLAGHPPAALTVRLGATAYLLLRLPWGPPRGALVARGIGLAALALGALLAAPVWVPFAEALRESATLGVAAIAFAAIGLSQLWARRGA